MATADRTHSPPAVTITGAAQPDIEDRPLDVATVYADHGDFVWASIQQLGVRDADLHDALQEVFIVVQKRLASFEGNSALRTWLFGICIRVVAAHRRRAYVRREQPTETPFEESPSNDEDPESAAMRQQARRRLQQVLDELDLDRRAVFVMFEIDELSCDEIAATLGVPIGTVYSRLHRARHDVERAIARLAARDSKGGVR